MPRPRSRKFVLARTAGTAFVDPSLYWVVNTLRHWGFDLTVLAGAAVAGAWWASGPGGLVLGPSADESADDLGRFLLTHDIVRYYPVFVGVLLCLAVLRTGRRVRPGARTGIQGTVQRTLTWGAVLFVSVPAFADVAFVPGSAVQRFVPCAAGAALAWVARIVVYSRLRPQTRTAAGFLLDRGVLRRRHGRQQVRRCLYLPFGTQAAQDAAIQVFAEVAVELNRIGGRAARAWAVATEIDYHLRINALDRVEELLSATDADSGSAGELVDEPAVMAAGGLFRHALGDDDKALCALRAAVAALQRQGKAVPRRLSLQLTAYQMFTNPTTLDAAKPTDMLRRPLLLAWLVWVRQPDMVLRLLLLRARQVASGDTELALLLAHRTSWLAEVLGKQGMFSDLSLAQSDDMLLVRAEADEYQADLNAEMCRYVDAAHWYLEAARLYQHRGRRSRQGVALVRGALAALRCTRENTRRESEQLDVLLRGLRMLEYDRGLLRDRHNRFAIVGTRDDLYSAVFDALNTAIHHRTARAAELALWLMESLHRSATAAAIRRGLDTTGNRVLAGLLDEHERAEARARTTQSETETPTTGDELSRLRKDIEESSSADFAKALVPELVDLEDIAERLGNRLALYYRCIRRDDRWTITVVAVSPRGLCLDQAEFVASDSDRTVNALLRPIGLLDALAGRDVTSTTKVHKTLPLDEPVWRALALGILPLRFEEWLRESRSTGPAVVVIVPDGPLAAVPFAGLPLRDGTTLIERCVPVYMPNLDMLRVTAPPPSNDRLVLTNVGEPGFTEKLTAMAIHDLTVVETDGRRAFLDRLSGPRRPDVAVVFNHGNLSDSPASQHIRMNDGGLLSSTTAWGLQWPRTVVLGACWASHISLQSSTEPLALATACLLGGASDVVGGQSKVITDRAAELLPGVVIAAAGGDNPAVALREEILDLFARNRRDRWRPAAYWATLAVWTTQPPAPSDTTTPDNRAWWTGRGAARERSVALFGRYEVPTAARLILGSGEVTTPARRLSTSLRTAMLHGQDANGGGPVTTVGLFRAILAVDHGDWTSFTVGAGVGEPPDPITTNTELSTNPIVLTFMDDRSVSVSSTLSAALDVGERLARHLKDPEITAGHVVYGMLSQEDSDARQWLTGPTTDRCRPAHLVE